VLISHGTVLSINDDLTCIIAGDNGERDAALCEQEHSHGERAVPRAPDSREGRRPSRHSRDQSSPAQHHAALVSQ
jgi:hypothetical protein